MELYIAKIENQKLKASVWLHVPFILGSLYDIHVGFAAMIF
jgi:hypothetical protein